MATTNEILRAMVGGTPPATAYTDELLRLLANTSDLSLETNDLFRILVGSTDKTLMTNPLLRLRTGPGFEQAMTNDLLLQIQGTGGFSGIPSAVASYDFVNGSSTGPALSVVRAGAAYVDDLAGTWTSVAPNTLRRSDKGLLVEGAQTNSIRNNSMQGAVVGTPGVVPTNWIRASGLNGLSFSVTGIGVESGIDYIECKLTGTPSATGSMYFQPDGSTILAAAQGQLWTFAAFLRFPSPPVGVTSVNQTIYEFDSGGSAVGNTNGPALNITQSPLGAQRFPINRTLAGATTAFVNGRVNIGYTSGVPVDFTIRIGWPQLEQWNTSVTSVGGASSPIRTTSAAVTRNADVVSATLPTPLATGTLFGTVALPIRTLSGTIAQLGPSSDRVVLRRGASDTSLMTVAEVVAGTTQTTANTASGTVPDNTRLGVAMAFAPRQVGLSVGGSAAVNAAPASALAAQSALLVGSGVQALAGYVERLTIRSDQASAAELATLSANPS